MRTTPTITPQDAGAIGERLVAAWFRSKGYTVTEGTKQAGSTDVKATSTTHKYLVQVKTAVTPNTPADLSSDEKRNIKSRATSIGYEAYSARVTLNADGTQLGEIVWSQL